MFSRHTLGHHTIGTIITWMLLMTLLVALLVTLFIALSILVTDKKL